MDIASDAAGALEGIYELKDGKLTVSYGIEGAVRPRTFDAAEGSSNLTIVYKKK